MPITIVWDNAEKTILRWIFEGNYTIEEYLDALQNKIRETAPLSHMIDVILDIRVGAYLPQGNILQAYKQTMDIAPSNLGFILFVSDHPAQRYFYGIYHNLYRIVRPQGASKMHFFDTLNEAYTFIAQERGEMLEAV